MARPSTSASHLQFSTAGTNTEPDSGHKTGGWATAEEPSAQFFNYWLNLAYSWLLYLDGLYNETITWTAAHTFNAGITLLGLFSASAASAAGLFKSTGAMASGSTLEARSTAGDGASGSGSVAYFHSDLASVIALSIGQTGGTFAIDVAANTDQGGSIRSGNFSTHVSTGFNDAQAGVHGYYAGGTTSAFAAGVKGSSGAGNNIGVWGLGGDGAGLSGGTGMQGNGGATNINGSFGGAGVAGIGGDSTVSGAVTASPGQGISGVGGNVTNGSGNTGGSSTGGIGGAFTGGNVTGDTHGRVGGIGVLAVGGSGQAGLGTAVKTIGDVHITVGNLVADQKGSFADEIFVNKDLANPTSANQLSGRGIHKAHASWASGGASPGLIDSWNVSSIAASTTEITVSLTQAMGSGKLPVATVSIVGLAGGSSGVLPVISAVTASSVKIKLIDLSASLASISFLNPSAASGFNLNVIVEGAQ